MKNKLLFMIMTICAIIGAMVMEIFHIKFDQKQSVTVYTQLGIYYISKDSLSEENEDYNVKLNISQAEMIELVSARDVRIWDAIPDSVKTDDHPVVVDRKLETGNQALYPVYRIKGWIEVDSSTTFADRQLIGYINSEENGYQYHEKPY